MTLSESPPSRWPAECGPYAPQPPLEGDLHVDVAVVGGGFTALATAVADAIRAHLRLADWWLERGPA